MCFAASTHPKFKLIRHQPTTHSGVPAADHPACPGAVPLDDGTVVQGMVALAAIVQVESCQVLLMELYQVLTMLFN